MDQSPRLSRGSIDRAAALRADHAALQELWAQGRVLVLRVGPDASMTVGETGLQWDSVDPSAQLPEDVWVLGVDPDGSAWVAVPDNAAQQGSLLQIGADLDDDEAVLATMAAALWHWHQTHRFCPADGTPTVSELGGWSRRCLSCGAEHFPRTDPAVIVLVTDPAGSKAILGRGALWPENFFSCLAGFVEAGESAEQCVVREVAEESGIRVREVRPIISQPWPFPRSLMLGYRAVADADAVPVVSDSELAEVRWFTREEVRTGAVKTPPDISVAHNLIARWLAETERQDF